MGATRIAAILLVIAGALALAYGGFTYTKQSTAVSLGPIELNVKEKKTVNIPVWAGIAALVIGGEAGHPVRAAGAGVVVYSGSGLIGYGELVIIKHSDEWLSAYAHNRKRLVAEGARVKAGDTIAEMGHSGANRDMLHFEIRRNGKPVDPLALLPRE